jgi:hypothetical protein
MSPLATYPGDRALTAIPYRAHSPASDWSQLPPFCASFHPPWRA